MRFRALMRWYRARGAFARTVAIPFSIAVLSVALRLLGDHIVGFGLAFIVITVLVFLQSYLPYVEAKSAKKVAEVEINAAKANAQAAQKELEEKEVTLKEKNDIIRSLETALESLNGLVERKGDVIRLSLAKHKDDPVKAVASAAKGINLDSTLCAVNEAMYEAAKASIEASQFGTDSHIVCSLVDLGANGFFRPIHVKCGFDSYDVVKRISKLRPDDNRSFASFLWHHDRNIYSSPTSSLIASGRFMPLNGPDHEPIKSILGYRIDVEGLPRMLWFIDANKERALPEAGRQEDADRLERFRKILSTYSARVRYELIFDRASDLFSRHLIANAEETK